jgi:predicted ABC-type transport system involved in lysophospholipase L1 biosynthesis ATPase subunit
MTAPAAPVLELRDVTRSLVQANGVPLTILAGVCLSVDDGESVAVVGRSGSGKSTLLSIMGLLSTPSSGSVRLWGTDCAALPDAARAALRNERIGFVFQSYSLVPHLTAAQNVALPLDYGRAVTLRAARERARTLLDAVGLAGLGHRYPRHLSGGEQQRVAIARALVRSPSLILADEPTGALDPGTATAVLDVLRSVSGARGSALVLVTHDDEIAAGMDRTVRLAAGRVASGPPVADPLSTGTPQ